MPETHKHFKLNKFILNIPEYAEKKLLISLIILCVAIVFYWKFLFMGPEWSIEGDVAGGASPLALMARNALLTFKEFPLWLHNFVGGQPLWPIVNVPIYGFPILVFCHSPFVFMRLMVFFSILLGGFSMFYLMRTFKVSSLVALISSIAFMLNPLFMERIRAFYFSVLGLPFVPLIIAFLWKVFYEKKSIYIIYLSITFSCLLQSANIVFIILLPILILFPVFILLNCDISFSRIKRNTLLWFSFTKSILCFLKYSFFIAILTFAFSAFILLPQAEYYSYTTRLTPSLGYNISGTSSSEDTVLSAIVNLIKDTAGVVTVFLAIFAFFQKDRIKTIIISLCLTTMIFLFVFYSSYNYLLPSFLDIWAKSVRVLSRILDASVVFIYILLGLGLNYLFTKICLYKRNFGVIFTLVFILYYPIITTVRINSLPPYARFRLSYNIRGNVKNLSTAQKRYQLIAPHGGYLVKEPIIEKICEDNYYDRYRIIFSIKNVEEATWSSKSSKSGEEGKVTLLLRINNNPIQEHNLPRDVPINTIAIIPAEVSIPKIEEIFNIKIDLSIKGYGQFNEREKEKFIEIGSIVNHIGEDGRLKTKFIIEGQGKVLGECLHPYELIRKNINFYNFRVFTLPRIDPYYTRCIAATYGLQLSSGEGGFLNNLLSYLENKTTTGPFTPGRMDGKSLMYLGILNSKYIIAEEKLDIVDPDLAAYPFYQGGLYTYENKKDIGRISAVKTAVLLIGKDLRKDFMSREAMTVTNLESFTPLCHAAYRGNTPYLDDYNIDLLNKFEAIILCDYAIKSKDKAEKLVRDCKKPIIYFKKDKNGYYTFANNSDREIIEGIFRSRTENIDVYWDIQRYSYNGLKIYIKTFSPNNFVLVSEMFFKDWNAYLNREPIPIFIADGMIRGVVINEPGEYILELKYQPKMFYFGLLLLFFSASGTIVYVLKKKRAE